MKFPDKFDGSDRPKYPQKKQSRRNRRGDAQVDEAIKIFPTDEEVSLRIEEPPVGEPSTEEAASSVVESPVEEVSSSVGKAPTEVASQSVVENAESAEVTPDAQEPAYNDIPFKQSRALDEIISTKKVWVNTPPPIIEALKSAGFKVIIASKGTIEKPGDVLQLSRNHNTELYSYSTAETILFLRQILFEQRKRSKHRKPAKKKLSQPPVEIEDAPLPVTEDSEDAVEANTLPVTIEGEVAQNQKPVTKDFVLGDAGMEDAVIQSETPKPNIGKERVQRMPELPIEILEDTENGSQEGTAEQKEASPVPERPKMVDESVLSAFGVTNENWEPIPEGENFSLEKIDEILERTLPEEGMAKQKEASPVPERPKMFDERFALEFGVTKEMWEQIPLHEKLSPEQQKLVFENLREFNERDKTPYLSKVWEGAMEKIGRKKDVSPTLAVLTQLVESSALYGPKVHEENGELLTDFVGVDIPRESRKEWKQTFDALNAAAHRMSKTPASWQEDGIGTHSERESKMMSFVKNTFSPARKRYKEYQEIQASYDAQKKELSRILGEAGYEPGVIAAKLVDIDKNVHMLQFQQTSPDAVEVIKDIPDADMWRKTGRFLFNHIDKLGYMGLGFLGRTALAGATGVLAAPLTSAAIAGGRAWDKSAAEMRERDRAARMGTRDSSKEALNIVSAEMTIDIAGEKREVGATQKLQYLIDKYSTLSQANDIEGPPSPRYIKDMNNLLESIRVRASYVEDKQRLNRINFGNKEERAVQMAKLYETLALAQMIVADNSNFPKIDEPIPDWRTSPKTLEERLASELSKNEDSIQNKRRSRQIKEASRSALTAGAFAYAGGLLAKEAQEMGLGEKLGKLMGTEKTPELSPFDEPLLTPEEIARANAGGASSLSENVPASPNAANFPYAEDAPMNPNAANFPYAEEAPMNSNAANLPYVEEAPMVSQHPPYTIRSGDTLTKILKEQIPEIQGLGKGQAQENAIANILRGLSAEELRSIGISSENPDLIYAGKDIDMNALHQIIESKQSIIDSAVTRFGVPADAVSEVASQTPASTSIPETASGDASVTPEVPKVVSAEAGEFGTVSKYEYLAGEQLTAEEATVRTMIWNEAQNGVEKWTKLYPQISSADAVKAGIIEGHFKNLFGARWSFAGGTNAVDFLEHGPRFTVENPERMVREFRVLAEVVAKPPMRIVPTPGEGVNAFLERASMAYALKGDALPADSLIRRIEQYYQLRGR